MKYVSYINSLIQEEIKKFDEFVLYGQNISTGSCLGGLTRDMARIKGCKTFNTPNTENALVGMGFGLMLGGTSSAFFMKQQDFLLLGVDHLRNTNNFIRQQTPSSSFTIVNITMDAGFEGIQSSLNNLSDFCAISNCDGYTISSKEDAVAIIKQCFARPGFQIISVSQRLFNAEILDLNIPTLQDGNFVIKYRQGEDITIACFNFSLPQGEKLHNQLLQIGVRGSLYGIAAVHPVDFGLVVNDAKKTGRLVIVDDSKSYASSSNQLEIESLRAGIDYIHIIKREITEDSYRPLSEQFHIDFNEIVRNISKAT